MIWISKNDYKKLIMRLFKEKGYHAKLAKSDFAKRVFAVLSEYEKSCEYHRGDC